MKSRKKLKQEQNLKMAKYLGYDILTILLATDGYKLSHRDQYPNNTELVFSNFTPRKVLTPYKHVFSDDLVVVSGLKYLFWKLQKDWMVFFKLSKKEAEIAINRYKKIVETYMDRTYDVTHIKQLYNYGAKHMRLPIKIYGLEDGTLAKVGTPIFTIWNEDPKFAWLTNYLETYLSANAWQSCTSATIARQFRLLLDEYADKTASQDAIDNNFVDYQAHDFSFRGMSSSQSAIYSGLGHLQFFKGSDTLPAVYIQQELYKDKTTKGVVATEHSVMCAGGKENELETFERLLDTYPKGILSIVSDTWDLWKVANEILPTLKDRILERDGKVVIRPDSGNPIDIICGTNMLAKVGNKKYTNEQIGLLRLIEKTFGSTINEKGYKVLNEKIGLIYGDSITLDIAKKMLIRLEKMGYSSENIVFGIGSYTYQYNTRDVFSFAIKATYVQIDGEAHNIFKSPITDLGKKSAKGITNVKDGELIQLSHLSDIENIDDNGEKSKTPLTDFIRFY